MHGQQNIKICILSVLCWMFTTSDQEVHNFTPNTLDAPVCQIQPRSDTKCSSRHIPEFINSDDDPWVIS